MKKRFAAVLAAAAIVGATSAFAANPFSDVTPSDWAYQAVSQLASAGIINGYPDGTFKGQKDVTRYEVAQMVAKAMAHEYRANAEQQALIGQLASEFAGELNNLGVRVDNVESKLGNVRISGDARVQYMHDKSGEQIDASEHNGKKDDFYSRVRLNIKAEVSEKTTVDARIKADYKAGQGGDKMIFDRLYVTQDMSSVVMQAGRIPVCLGSSFIFDGPTVDGVTAATKLDKANVSVGYGYADLENFKADRKTPIKQSQYDSNSTMVFGQVDGDIMKNVNLAAYYVKMTSSNQESQLRHNVMGAAINGQFNKVWVGGEYGKVASAKDGYKVDGERDYAWTAGLGYGLFDMAKPGSFDVKMQYINAPKNTPVIASTMDFTRFNDVKGWMATVDYGIAPNLGLSAVYNFDTKDLAGNDIKDFYFVQLNYQF